MYHKINGLKIENNLLLLFQKFLTVSCKPRKILVFKTKSISNIFIRYENFKKIFRKHDFSICINKWFQKIVEPFFRKKKFFHVINSIVLKSIFILRTILFTMNSVVPKLYRKFFIQKLAVMFLNFVHFSFFYFYTNSYFQEKKNSRTIK